MSFVHLSLLVLGGLLTAVPIVLHLAMRPKPKHQVFPALRFLRRRQVINQRRLRLRQAALLLLRCLTVLILALALARPSVDSARLGSWFVAGALALLLLIVIALAAVAAVNRRGWALITFLVLLATGLVAGLVNSALALMRDRPPALLGDRQAAVAAAILVDTSPRMRYRYGNQSRLERAKEIAHWLVRQFPPDSRVAIIDSSSVSASFAVDLGAAATGINAIESTFLPQPLSRLVVESLRVLDQADRLRKELYIVSDLTHASWDDVANSDVAERLRQATDVTVQVIDVGIEQPSNTSLSDLRLSQSSLTPGSPLQLSARVTRQGEAAEVTVQLFVESAEQSQPVVIDGQLQTPSATVRGTQTARATDDSDQEVTFSLAALSAGTHHGYLEVDGADGLDVDDRQYFTVHVRAPWDVLVVASDGSEPHFLTEWLSPLAFREQGRAKFTCAVVPIEQLTDRRLRDFDAVGLLDPPPLSDAAWRQLQQYVQRGGGVALFLGRNARSATAFNTQAAVEMLPAPIERQWNAPEGVSLAPRDYDQPLLAVMREFRTTVPWDSLPVFQHWVVGPLQTDSRTLIDYSNNKPALLERLIGDGRLMMLTTPISDPDLRGRPPWNLLPISLESLPFMILIDRLFLSLVQSNDAPLNYWVGQPAQLPVEAATSERFSLVTPLGTWLELTSSRGQLQVPFTDTLGIYRLNVDPTSTLPRGFSVNLPAASSRLHRIDGDQLEQALGPGRARLARTETEIVRDIDQSRVGKEFYPFLLPLLVVILALEYVTANRFYPESP